MLGNMVCIYVLLSSNTIVKNKGTIMKTNINQKSYLLKNLILTNLL